MKLILVDTFANGLKKYRTDNDWTLEEMSKITTVPPQTLNRYELGQRVPKIDVACNIAMSLNVDPMWIQGYNVENKTSPSDVKKELTETLISMGVIDEDRPISDGEYKKLSTVLSAFLDKGNQ